jgi:hypothetical protein
MNNLLFIELVEFRAKYRHLDDILEATLHNENQFFENRSDIILLERLKLAKKAAGELIDIINKHSG